MSESALRDARILADILSENEAQKRRLTDFLAGLVRGLKIADSADQAREEATANTE